MITSEFYETKDIKSMADKYIELEIKSEVPLHGFNKGQIVKVKVDRNGTPYDKNWRRRLKDSKIDGCVEIIKSPAKKKESK